MRKLLKLVLVMGLSIGLVAGCSGNNGGGGNEDVDVADIISPIKDKIIADLRAQGYTDDDFEYEEVPGYILENVSADQLGISDALFEEGKAIRAGMDLNADHIMVFKAKPGKANELKVKLQSYQQERYEFWADYIVEQAEKVNNAIIKVKGSYVYYIIYEDAADIEAIINEVLN